MQAVRIRQKLNSPQHLSQAPCPCFQQPDLVLVPISALFCIADII